MKVIRTVGIVSPGSSSYRFTGAQQVLHQSSRILKNYFLIKFRNKALSPQLDLGSRLKQLENMINCDLRKREIETN